MIWNNHIYFVRNMYGYFFMRKCRRFYKILQRIDRNKAARGVGIAMLTLCLLAAAFPRNCNGQILTHQNLVQIETKQIETKQIETKQKGGAQEGQTQKVELPESELYSKACALIDGESGRLLYGKNELDGMANASTTKIMTCILALESGMCDEAVTVTANAAAQPKVHLGMRENEQFYLKDLLYGLMLESYNDCAVAIAEHVSGSVEEFVKLMNEKAEKLGCEDTHFVTPNGLDGEDEEGEHHTTAYDLCLIMRYCAWESDASEEFLALTQTKNYSFCDLEGQSFSVYNHNSFLDMMDTAITGKTGFTSKAGYCYVAAVEDGQRKYCIALLACGWPDNKNYKWEDAKKLFAYGCDYYHLYQAEESALDLLPIEVGSGVKTGTLEEWGKRSSLKLYVDNGPEDMLFLKADWDDAMIQKEFVNHVALPVEEGDVLGKIYYRIGGEILYSYDICAAEEIKEWNFPAFLRALWQEFTLASQSEM